MIAVTAFVAGRPARRTAMQFGARWGAGHGLAVLLAGGILLATGLRWPERWDAWGEAAVGVMLIAVGVWALLRARQVHLHPPAEHGDHAHLHAHTHPAGHHHEAHRAAGAPHHHGHGITAVGLLHGLAGTSAAVALVPVTLIDRTWLGVAYLVAFGVGTVVAMTTFALVAAVSMQRAAGESLTWARRLGRLAGLGSVVVGVWWVVGGL